MQYEKCLHCHNLGSSCKGPNFVQMSAHEIVEWCKARKSLLRMTNEKLAELSGVPIGTINRLFSNKSADFYFETVRPIIKALVAGDWSEEKCHTDHEEISKHSEDTIKRLEKDIARLEKENERIIERGEKEKAELINLSHFCRRIIVVLAVALGVAVTLIIAALIYDSLDPNAGFLWLS